MLFKVLVGSGQTLFQPHLSMPAQGIESAAVHPLARCAIRLGGVKGDLALVPDRLADGLSHFSNRDVAAKTHIDVALHRLGMLVVSGFVQMHDKHTGCRHVIHVQKLAFGSATAPDGHRGRANTLAS